MPETPPAVALATSPVRRIFSGTPSSSGVIGLLAFVALAFVWFPVQGGLIRHGLSGMGSGGRYVIGHLVQLGEVLLFAWAASKLERRSFGAYGLPWNEVLRSRFWQGAAIGIGSLSVLVLALAALGALRLAPPPQTGPLALLIGAGYLLLFAILALREEFLYRGYGLSTLGGQIGFWPAAVLSSAWFLFGHAGNSGETALGLAAVGVFGMLACVVLRRSGSLWMPIGFHAAWNWGQTFLFGVGDSGHAAAPGHFFTASVPTTSPAWLSGGATGPEGSVLCLALFAVLVVMFAVRGRKPTV
jgi:CAAX protease family protein